MKTGNGDDKLTRTPKRHWVATLLAVWMFADAFLMLFQQAVQLYSVWGFHHRVRMSHPPIWHLVMLAYLWGLLSFLPAPHLLLALREAILFHLLHLPHTSSLLRDSLLNMTVLGISVAMGYGLLRMRQWARWSYAGLCIISLVLTLFFQWAASGHPYAVVYGWIGGFILPSVLLVFLIRRGLVAQTPASP
jgi:hypothetical protein